MTPAKRAEEFALRLIVPAAAQWERERAPLPRELVREWSATGLNALQVSAARGGGGGSFHTKLEVAEALATVDFAAAFALNNMQGSVTRLEREGTPQQIARFLPDLMSGEKICAPSLSEPGAGSDFAAITTTATKVPGGWEITGEKAWITNGAIADLLVLYAQTEPGSGAQGIASFLVDVHAPGVERLPPYALVGGHAIGACGIRFTRVRVEDENLFAPPSRAFKAGLRGITSARTHVAAMVCAMVDSALRLAVGYATKRQAFGKPLLDHQGLRWQLVDVATELEAARLLTARAADIIAAGGDAQVEAALAKKFAAQMAARCIAACMQAMGAEGLADRYPIGRQMAAARIAALVDGSTEMQNERIGAALAARYGAKHETS